MKITVTVKPGSKVDAVENVDDGLIVRTKARTIDGRANEAVVKLLAKHFGVAKTRVRIVHGLAGRQKFVVVD